MLKRMLPFILIIIIILFLNSSCSSSKKDDIVFGTSTGTGTGTGTDTGTGTGTGPGYTAESGTVTVGPTWYAYYVPAAYFEQNDGGTVNWPLVCYLHGHGGDPQSEMTSRDWDQAATTKGFIYIGPHGTDTVNGYDTWAIPADEANIMSCFNDIGGKFNIDLGQVYQVGFSAGGQMTSYFCSRINGAGIKAMGYFCAPGTGCQLRYQDPPTKKVPAYNTSNSGDMNYSSMQTWNTFLVGKGHISTFVDQTTVSTHDYDRTTIEACYDWMASQ